MEDKGSLWGNILNDLKNRAYKVKDDILGKIEDREIDKNTLKKGLAGFMVVCILAIGFTGYKVNEIRTRAFDLYIDEFKIGSIREESLLPELISELEKDLSQKYGVDIVINKNVNTEASHVKDRDLTPKDELKQILKSKTDFLVSASAITIDGEEVGVLNCEEDARDLVAEIQEYNIANLPDDTNIKDVKILEDIQYIKKEVPLSEISNREELIEYIRTGSEEIKTHTIEVGENFWTLAIMYKTTMEEIEKANPDKDTLKLRPGDVINLVRPTSKITVETIEEVEYAEAINFEVKVEEDKNMYKNQQKVKVEGQRGESRVLAREIKHNGILVDKEIIEEQVVKKPVEQVVVKGTKEVPRTVATGMFQMPTRGTITSRYGRRWGRMHNGLDIGAPTGTAIKAADGGTVAFAGYKGSFGYMVEINHGNGYRTRYAHCSKLLVSAGQKVYKGQHIANVGNTGRSTGPHLHFEVLKNGTNQNPSNFVR